MAPPRLPRGYSVETTNAAAATRRSLPQVSYRTSKAALNMVVACVAVEWRKTHEDACVVALHPGWVDTDMGSRGGTVKPPLEAPEVVAGIIAVVDDLSAADTGKFLDWKSGAVVPW